MGAIARPWRQVLGLRAPATVLSVAALEPFSYWFSMVPFQFVVAQATGQDPIHLAFLYVALLIPAIVTNPVVGVWADRFDRRLVASACDLVTFAATLTAGVIALGGEPSLPAIYVLATIVGLAHASGMSVGQSLLAPYTPRELLPTALTLQAVALNTARAVGPLAAGLALALTSSSVAFWCYSLTSAVCFFLLRSLPPRPREAAPDRDAESILASATSGLRHARERPPAALLLISVASMSTLGISFLVQFPGIAARAGITDESFVYLTASLGTGSLAGVVLLAAVGTARLGLRFVAGSQVLLGVMVVLLAHATVAPVQAAIVGFAGAVQFGGLTVANVMIQTSIDDSHRGRVMSFFHTCWSGLIPVGGLLLGLVWSLTSGTVALSAFGVGTVGFGLLVFARARRRGVVTVDTTKIQYKDYK